MPARARLWPRRLCCLLLGLVLSHSTSAWTVHAQEVVERGGTRWILLAEDQQLADLVVAASELFGISIEYDPKALEGAALTVRLAEPVSEDALWLLINRALAQKGLASVQPPGSASLAIVPIADAPKLARVESVDLRGSRAGFVKVLVPLQREKADGIVEAITPLLSKAGSASAFKEPSAVLVADLRPHVEQALEALRVIGAPASLAVEEYRPVHVGPTALVGLVERVRQAEKAQTREEPKGSLLAIPESASVLVLAGRETAQSLLGMLRRFDRPEEVETRQYVPRRFGLKETEGLLRRVLEGTTSQPTRLRMVADELTGTLFVTAPPSEHARLEELFQRLERAEPGLARSVRTFAIKNRSVDELAELLRGLVEQGAIAEAPKPVADVPREAGVQGATAPITAEIPPPPKPDEQRLVIAVDRPTNRLVALGEPRELDRLEGLIKELDRRHSQVLVEAFAVSLTESEMQDLGVELEKVWTSGGATVDVASLFGLGGAPLSGGIDPVPAPGQGFTGAVLDPGSFQALVRALEVVNQGRALTIPKLLVNNNQTATLDSVIQSPFASTNASTTVATTSFGGTLDAGTQISVTPQIAEGDLLLLDYQVSISRFVGESPSPSLPPPRQETKLASVATVPDGYTVVVGGIEVESKADGRSQVPILGSIPGLGLLFQNRSRSSERSRFFVFLRASVMRGSNFEELRYVSAHDLAEAALEDGWPVLEPRVIR